MLQIYEYKIYPCYAEKFEELYDEIGYSVRFEKGNFHSGYCILQDKRIAVINKFLTLEGRINALMDILPSLEIDTSKLSGNHISSMI
ncbi:MAG: hypothetical protein HWD58_16440 [Bacteroidota bacterium]|nr:MAG: hypothetical protein HWD58_16440 [Bacteroidota bacterium]